MKIALIIVVIVALSISLGLFVLVKKSKTAPELGLHDGRLLPCVYSTNCVNSMGLGDEAIAPLRVKNAVLSWQQLPQLLEVMGGQVEKQSDHYVHATFESKGLGFVDDMELFLDRDNLLIHVRSASRVGRSDFGVNRERVERLRRELVDPGASPG